MNRWEIIPQVVTRKGVEYHVLAKFSRWVAVQTGSEIEFQPLPKSKAWVSVLLHYTCHDGSVDRYKVNYSIRSGTYSFHSPDTEVDVRIKGKVTNPFNPLKKTQKNVENGLTRSAVQSLLSDRCGGRKDRTVGDAFSNRILQLIDDCLKENNAGEFAQEKKPRRRSTSSKADRPKFTSILD